MVFNTDYESMLQYCLPYLSYHLSLRHLFCLLKSDRLRQVLLYQHDGLVLLNSLLKNFVCLFVCFVALRPKSTAMVMAGQSVHLTTLFPEQA